MSTQFRRRVVDLADQLTDAIGEAHYWWDQAHKRIVDADTRQRASANLKKQVNRTAYKPSMNCPTTVQH